MLGKLAAYLAFQPMIEVLVKGSPMESSPGLMSKFREPLAAYELGYWRYVEENQG